MMEMKLIEKKDPQDMLTRLDAVAHELSEVGAIVPERMTSQCFLQALSEKYHFKNAMLEGKSLKREILVTRTLARYQSVKDSQAISREALVVKEGSQRRGRSRLRGRLRVNPSLSFFQCYRPGHDEAKCPMKSTCPGCGGRGHTAEQCGTDSKALAVSDSKCSRD